MADSALTTNVIRLHDRSLVYTAPPPETPAPEPLTREGILLAGLLMAIREQGPVTRNKLWHRIAFHTGRFQEIPGARLLADRAMDVLAQINNAALQGERDGAN